MQFFFLCIILQYKKESQIRNIRTSTIPNLGTLFNFFYYVLSYIIEESLKLRIMRTSTIPNLGSLCTIFSYALSYNKEETLKSGIIPTSVIPNFGPFAKFFFIYYLTIQKKASNLQLSGPRRIRFSDIFGFQNLL